MDFITKYMEYVAPLKGSPRFHLWSIIAVVSAVLERRCYTGVWNERHYPNLFVCLAGPAGCGKSFSSKAAVYFAKKLNQEESLKGQTGIKFMSDKLTPAAMLKQFQRAQKVLGSYKYCSLFSFADELSSFILDIGGGSLADDILKFYDAPDHFEKEIIKNNENIVILNSSLTTLWDTTPDFLRRYMPNELSREGIGSRIVFVADYDFHFYDRVPAATDKDLEAELLNALFEIYCMHGEMRETPGAGALLDQYHKEIHLAQKSMCLHTNYSHYMARKSTHIRKLQIVSAASRGSMSIEESYAYRAYDWVTELEPSMSQIFGLQDGSKLPDAALVILEHIPDTGIWEEELIQTMIAGGLLFTMDSKWDGFINTLVKGGYAHQSEKDGRTFYKRRRRAR